MAGERDIRLEKLWINRCWKKKKKKEQLLFSVNVVYGARREEKSVCGARYWKSDPGNRICICIWAWFLVYFHLVCFLLPGKLKRLSRWPLGEGLGGGVALGGLLCWKGAGEEGVDEVVEDGLLLESSWFSTGGWSWWGGWRTQANTDQSSSITVALHYIQDDSRWFCNLFWFHFTL